MTLTFYNIRCKEFIQKYSHNYGIEVINFWIEKHPQTLHPIFSREFDLESIKKILEKIHFLFNNSLFAPTYATLTMGYFEVQLYDICEVKWGSEFKEFLIKIWILGRLQTPLHREKVLPQELL